MATTSIWSVKGWLGKVVIYVENPEKTKNPAYFKKQDMTAAQTQGLTDVIDYATQSRKTQSTDERAEILQHYVTGVNCQPKTARDEMMAAKKRFSKEDGVVAYHGYQSFAQGEVTPDIAHEIGVKLAKRLWGDKYQVVVATHLDKDSHIHSHFVVNTVSWVDGIRYHRTKQDYIAMKKESDALCREYGLSVIENPECGKTKQYAEWQAERESRPTWRGIVKTDVDMAIAQSMTERQFWDNLRKMGYEIKQGKDISVRPPGKERFVRLYRNFGDDYAIEGIRRRILAQSRPERLIIMPEKTHRQCRVKSSRKTTRRVTGLRALYFYYLYRMGALPKKRQPNPRRVYFLFREDIRHMQNISQETRLLVKHSINTDQQLAEYKESVTAQMILLSKKRKRLRNHMRDVTDEGRTAEIKSEIADLSEQIGKLRREVRLCEDIESRSGIMKDKLKNAREYEKPARKENVKHESFRRRG